jgi:hypothetical protein
MSEDIEGDLAKEIAEAAAEADTTHDRITVALLRVLSLAGFVVAVSHTVR